MKRAWAAAFCIILIASVTPARSAEVIRGHARALDGDTLMVDGTRVRLHGVDAPEMSGPRGPVSRGQLDDLVDGRLVACQPTGDTSHGRPVATCSVGGRDLGAAMIEGGWAFADRTLKAGYDDEEVRAREAGAGFWEPQDRKDGWDKAAVVGSLVAGFGLMISVWLAACLHRRQRRWEIKQEKQALAAALSGEISALCDMVEHHRYIDHFSAVAAHWEQGNRLEPPMLDVQQKYFTVYEMNAGRLGLLPPSLVAPVAGMYTMANSVLEDFRTLHNKEWQNHRTEAVAAFLRRIEGSMKELLDWGRALAAELEEVADGT